MPHGATIASLLFALCHVMAPVSASAGSLTIFAAASLKTVLEDIAAAYEEQAGHEVVISAAASSALARQIGFGAPADIFISANKAWMDQLETDGLIIAGSRFDLAANRLVLIAHGNGVEAQEITPDLDLGAMLGEGRLAMALVKAAPAGIYGKAALTSLDLWDDIEQDVAQADNVRAALALVATGEAPLGIVYTTDAMAEPRVSVIGTFPVTSHPQIVYPAAIIAGRQTPEAEDFLRHLQTGPAKEILRAAGFSPVSR